MADKKLPDGYSVVPETKAKDEPKFVYTDVPATDDKGNLIDSAKAGGAKSGKPTGSADKKE